VNAPVPEYNEDGYPTDESLTAIETFVGTPEALIEYATALLKVGSHTVEDGFDDWPQQVKRVTFVTGGWSGAESVLGALSYHTIFHRLFWESSHRGGMEIYEIPLSRWTEPTSLGRFDLPPNTAAADLQSTTKGTPPS
jgi:hypothetical protein